MEKVMKIIIAKMKVIYRQINSSLRQEKHRYRTRCIPIAKVRTRGLLQLVGPRKPSANLSLLAKAFAILLRLKPVKVPGPRPGQFVYDYYLPTQLYIRAFALDFLRMIRKYKVEKLSATGANQIKRTLLDTNFSFKAMSQAHRGGGVLAHWISSLSLYRIKIARVAPKIKKFTAMKKKVKQMNSHRIAVVKLLRKLYKYLFRLNRDQNQIYIRLSSMISVIPTKIKNMRAARNIAKRISSTLKVWKITLIKLRRRRLACFGDMLMAAASLHYAGPFPDKYRPLVINTWAKILELNENKVPHSSNSKNIVKLLTTHDEKENWWKHGLSRSSYFTECATITNHTRRIPVLIDPQYIAYEWLRNQYSKKLKQIKMSDSALMETLFDSIRIGATLLVETDTGSVSSGLDPILHRWTFFANGDEWIAIRNRRMKYHEKFRLFILTAEFEPDLSPELYSKVTVINFSYGIRSLRNTLLSTINELFLPGLQNELNKIYENVEKERALRKELRESIAVQLNLMKTILSPRSHWLTFFKESRAKDLLCQKRIRKVKVALDIVTLMLMKYHDVTKYPAQLFFCFSGFEVLNSAYLFAFDWYRQNFREIIKNIPKGVTDINKIRRIVNKKFFLLMYDKFIRFVFEKDMLQFRFWLSVRLLKYKNLIKNENLKFFIHGNKGKAKEVNVCPYTWIPQKMWDTIKSMEELKDFSKFLHDFKNNPYKFISIFTTFNPYRELLPKPWQGELRQFHRLVIIKCFRPEMLRESMEEFVADQLGKKIDDDSSIQIKIEKMYMDSDKSVPLLFCLSPGSDITAELLTFAKEHLEENKLITISHISGTSFDLIRDAMGTGDWVFLQNVHLMKLRSFTAVAQSIVSTKPETIKDSFRFWISSEETPAFPRFIARMASKMCVHSFSGMKSHMIRAYKSVLTDHEELLNTKRNRNAQIIRYLIFSLCYFHGLIFERARFGTLVTNLPYRFEDLDFDISVRQLLWFIKEYGDEIPLQLITFFFSDLNYGGRVIDVWDMDTVRALISECLEPAVLNSFYSYDTESYFHQLPVDSTSTDYLKYMKYLPTDISPRICGLTECYGLAIKIKEGEECLDQLRLLHPEFPKPHTLDYKSADKLGRAIIEYLPLLEPSLIEFIETFRLDYTNPLTIHLREEVIRYYQLLEEIRYSIRRMLNELAGISMITDETDGIAESIVRHNVPTTWQQKSFPTTKALGITIFISL
ncbi:unnamed protein product, partial [Nezara viridula]